LAQPIPPSCRTPRCSSATLLVDQLKTLRYRDGMRVAKYWLSAAHDAVAHDPWSRAVENRFVSAVRTIGDSVGLEGMPDAISGTVFMNELRPLEQQLFEADWTHVRAKHGDEARADQPARTPGLRRAIEVRDRHCQHPSGCDVPAEECDIDHKVPYSEGGLTTQGNGRC
jgi:hypothetical protein